MANQVIHMAAEALQPQPPIDFIVDKVFTRGSLSLIVGAGGDGKTYTMMYTGVQVAQGKPCFGTRPTKQGPVLFVDEESGLSRFNVRLGNIMRGAGADDSLPFFYTSLSLFDFRKKSALNDLKQIITNNGITFCVIDALVDVTPGADENLSKDMAPVLQGLRSICESTRCAIVVIHHMGKNNTYRGSTALRGAVDLMLYVTKKGNRITLSSEKSRDSEPFEFTLEAHFGSDTFDLTETGAAAKTQADDARALGAGERSILVSLARNGTSSKSAIEAGADGCSPQTVRNSFYSSRLKPYIERVDAGGPGAAAFYRLTPAGLSLCASQNWIDDPYLSAELADDF